MNKTKIIFRTDASLRIGSGHVMRCLTLAEALRESGAKVEFICRAHSGNMIELIRLKEFYVHKLPVLKSQESEPVPDIENKYNSWLGTSQEHDASETIKTFQEKRPDWVIIDHYSIDRSWERKVKHFCRKIMVIDDMANRQHDCDLLLDHGLFPNLEKRYEGLLPSRCKHLLGPKYAMLAPEYIRLRKKALPRKSVLRLLIFFGGSDKFNLTGRALDVFKHLTNTDLQHMDVVIGASNSKKRILKKQAYTLPNVTLHYNLPSLAPLMLKADIFLGAGGITTYERMCLKLPSVAVAISENQETVVKYLHQLRIQCALKKNFTTKDVKQSIDEVKSINFNLMSDIVDGLGLNRVSTELINI